MSRNTQNGVESAAGASSYGVRVGAKVAVGAWVIEGKGLGRDDGVVDGLLVEEAALGLDVDGALVEVGA